MMNADNSPFNLDNDAAYQKWRAHKLEALQKQAISAVRIANPANISADEYRRLSAQIGTFNVAVFKIRANPEISGDTLKNLGAQLGLTHLDDNLYAGNNGISELRVADGGRRGEYIPYTDHPLGWHTDGYYNDPGKTIRAFILYCVKPAAEGGDNQLLDPELAYIHLRDHDHSLINALLRPDTFTIPETIEDGRRIRPQQQNPVFQVDARSGELLMRYTQRKTHIQWRQDSSTQAALCLLKDLLAGDSPHILSVRLRSGEGLICNNALHNRSAFANNPERPRIMLRARYHDRFRSYPDA